MSIRSSKILLTGFIACAVVTTMVASVESDNSTPTTNQSFFQPRPASANMAREMLMQPGSKHLDCNGWYGEFSVTGFYQRSWNQNVENSTGDSDNNLSISGLAMMPFWSGSNVMTVGSNLSTVATATVPANIDAYQFGMGNVVVGSSPEIISINPIVYQAGADFMMIVGSSENESGFLLKIKAPLATYNMNPQFYSSNNLAAQNYTAGQIQENNNVFYPIATTMAQAFAGNIGSDGQVPQGNFTPMKYGLINGDLSSGARFADIEFTLGYQFVSEEDNAFSIALRASAPTGNKAQAVYLLEPIVGRGGSFGLGGYTAGRFVAWQGSHDDRLTIKFMGDVMHLFQTTTMRSYDLIANGPGSRYLLVADYLNGQYQSVIQNLINVTTLESKSSFAVEGDIAVAFNYSRRGWGLDLGYEFYGRSAETLTITGSLANQEFAILGRQSVALANGVASTLCQPTATIGTSVAHQDVVGGVVFDATVATNRIGTTGASNANDLLNVAAATQKAYLTSKVFTRVAYEWEESKYVPFLGVIAEFEISNSSNNALSQWAASLVGGISF